MHDQKIIELELDDANKAKINLHGATVTSWVANSQEILFVSKKSVFDNKKAIRGGIPVIFPNFGPWSDGRPQHGFARVKPWIIKNPVSKDGDSVKMTLSLTDDEETRKLWNYSFELEYELTLTKNKLKTTFIVKNNGIDSFDFTSLLHTYFKVDDIDKVTIHQLKDTEYIDKVKNGSKSKDTNESIKISEEIDRVYIATKNEHYLEGCSDSIKRISIVKENFPDTVVWNPWIEKAKAMADFDDLEYKNMVCVEAGYVNQRYVLAPEQTATSSQELTVLF